MIKHQGEFTVLPVTRQHDYQGLLTYGHDVVPAYLEEEDLWTPYIHEPSDYDRLVKTQKALQIGCGALLRTVHTDERLQALLAPQLTEPIREELDKLEHVPMSPQLLRPDYIYDRQGRPRICEINARFIFNGNIASTFMARYLGGVYDIDIEPYQRLDGWLHDAYDGHDTDDGPTVFVQESEPEHDILLQKQRSAQSRSVNPEALKLLDPAKLGRLVLELHQHELADVLEDVVSLKLAGVPVHNDPRVVMILHDKRLLVPLSDEEYMSSLTDEDTARTLAEGVIPSYHPAWEGREPENIESKSAFAKGAISGKCDSLHVVKLSDYRDRLDDPASYVYQPRFTQPKIKVSRGEAVEVAGTLPMALDDEVFGPGIMRVYPHRRLKGFKGLTVAVRGEET